MGFDLATAQPVAAPTAPPTAPATKGGFDLSSAAPVTYEQPRGGLKAGFAGLADTVLGIVPQAVAETGYAGVRALEGAGLAKPGQALSGKSAFLAKYGNPAGNALGVTNTPDYQNEASQRLSRFIGTYYDKGADWISQQTGLPKADVENMMFSMSFAIPGAAREVKQVGGKVVDAAKPVVTDLANKAVESPVGQAIVKPIQERNARIAQERSTKSWQDANRIEAAQRANQLGIALNPAASNPTAMNKLKAATTGKTNVNETLSTANEPRWTELAKEDMGLPKDSVLDASAFEQARQNVSGPYDAIRSIPTLAPDNGVIAQIRALRNDKLIGQKAVDAEVNALIEDAVAHIENSMSGDTVVKNIRQLRKDATTAYNSTAATPAQRAVADANMGIADALESLIEANINDPKVLGDFRKARTAMAKTYEYEKATDLNTGRLNPVALSKLTKTSKGAHLTGTIADIANIAGNFPDIAQVGPRTPQTLTERITRSGPSGTLGFVLGSTVGQPLAGAVAGATVGNVLSAWNAKRMASPAYQAAHAVPTDFRIPVKPEPAMPRSSTNNLPVPYDYRNALVGAENRPNWVFGQSIPDPDVRVGMPTPAAPMLEAPSAESTLRTVEQRRRYDYELQKHLDQMEDQRQAAGEAASRRPTGGEVVFDLDPVTGKLRMVDQGLKGATPEVMQSTGHSLASAADKVSSGRQFAMSAEERISWEKTKTDVMEVSPEFKNLTDKQIAEKTMDRQWVADAVKKAKEKAQAFEELAAREKSAQAVREAVAKREQMLDFAESLEEQLGKPRPVRSNTQGAKTREAIRQNNLAKPTENKNSLNRQ